MEKINKKTNNNKTLRPTRTKPAHCGVHYIRINYMKFAVERLIYCLGIFLNSLFFACVLWFMILCFYLYVLCIYICFSLNVFLVLFHSLLFSLNFVSFSCFFSGKGRRGFGRGGEEKVIRIYCMKNIFY